MSRMKRILILDCSAPRLGRPCPVPPCPWDPRAKSPAGPVASARARRQSEVLRRSRTAAPSTPRAATSLLSDLVRRLFVAYPWLISFIATMTRARGRAGGLAKLVLRQRLGVREMRRPSPVAFLGRLLYRRISLW